MTHLGAAPSQPQAKATAEVQPETPEYQMQRLAEEVLRLPSASQPGYFAKEGYQEARTSAENRIIGLMAEIALRYVNPDRSNTEQVMRWLQGNLRNTSPEIGLRVVAEMMRQIGKPQENTPVSDIQGFIQTAKDSVRCAMGNHHS
ncbi:MAG: hypothetical protein WC101_03020 [Candidatus Gracilibacteria bacterium]